MILIHDTRDKEDKHKNLTEWLIENGHKIVRSKMFVGDIAKLHDQTLCIDLKQGLNEVYANLISKSEHTRFRNECIRAKENGIKLIVLVEEDLVHTYEDVCRWNNPRVAYWHRVHNAQQRGLMLDKRIARKPPVSSENLAKAMATMTTKYGIDWMFCSKQDVGKTVIEILERS